MNAEERATVAKAVADYMISKLEVNAPILYKDLGSVAQRIIEDKASQDKEEIRKLTLEYLLDHPKTVLRIEDGKAWLYLKETPPQS
jgi:hypothetical protein